jgi:hypothetical protein
VLVTVQYETYRSPGFNHGDSRGLSLNWSIDHRVSAVECVDDALKAAERFGIFVGSAKSLSAERYSTGDTDHAGLAVAEPATMHVIGEETSQRLDVVPAQFWVIVMHRPKYACRACEQAVQAVASVHA